MSSALPNKQSILAQTIEHFDITTTDTRPMIEQMSKMAFSARDTARATAIVRDMVKDESCAVILCLAGSLISAGLKKVIIDMLRANMVDAIVSTGANIVDQDFFEALGYRHYVAGEELKYGAHDDELRELAIDRIYDTLIDEDELRECDDTIQRIADSLEPGVYSSRQFIEKMGEYLEDKGCTVDSIVLEARRKGVPIFVPAFSDCSAGFGLVAHQAAKSAVNEMVTIDSVRDFHELTKIKIEAGTTGLFMIGGGVPKNFAQDVVVAADILGADASMHQYAVQITVADSRDGALSGSTLKEACSWGKVSMAQEQMVYAEATLVMPMIAAAVYHDRDWEARTERRYNDLLNATEAASV